MISKLLENKGVFYCSNCRMRQFDLKPNCLFCGNQFYNYEDVIIQMENDKVIDSIKTNPETKVK